MFRNHKKRPCVCHVAGERIATLEVGGMVWICLRPSQDPNWELYNVCTSENQHGTPQWRFGRWLPFKRVLFGFHVNQFSGRIQKTWCQLTFWDSSKRSETRYVGGFFWVATPQYLKIECGAVILHRSVSHLPRFFFPQKPSDGCFPKKGYPKMDGLWWKTLFKWMIWGYPYIRKHPDKWRNIEYLGGAGSAQPYWREKIKARNRKKKSTGKKWLESIWWFQTCILGLNGVSWFS